LFVNVHKMFTVFALLLIDMDPMFLYHMSIY